MIKYFLWKSVEDEVRLCYVHAYIGGCTYHYFSCYLLFYFKREQRLKGH